MNNDKGQALIEFAIVLPVLLIFILGIAQFALIMNAYSIVNYAAFSACRSGIVNNADDGKMKIAASIVCSPISGNTINSFLKTSVNKELIQKKGTIPVNDLKVTVTHYYKLAFPVVGKLFNIFWGGININGSVHIPIKATCVMRIEDQ
jgi:Flp pilus assembly protein TadG